MKNFYPTTQAFVRLGVVASMCTAVLSCDRDDRKTASLTGLDYPSENTGDLHTPDLSANRFDLGTDFDGPVLNDEGSDGLTRCDIDFLFVIDNSRSMANEQESLANSVPEFINTVTREIPELENFHIGVVTTDAYSSNGPGCDVLGGLVTGTSGPDSSDATCIPYASGAHFMTRDDDLYRSFVCAARPGVGGSGNEKPMEAMVKAVSSPLAQAGACNSGFIRDHALLVVTVITDEEDDSESFLPIGDQGSAGEPADWYQSLLAAKGGDERMVVVLGLIGTEEPNACERTWYPGDLLGNVLGNGAEVSERVRRFVEMFAGRGFVGDVCAPNYDPFFEQAVGVIDFACGEIPPA